MGTEHQQVDSYHSCTVPQEHRDRRSGFSELEVTSVSAFWLSGKPPALSICVGTRTRDLGSRRCYF